MPPKLRIATLFVALLVTLSACADATTQASQSVTASPAAPTEAPTATPSPTAEPTAVPTLASDITVAGVDVGGLDLDAARKKLSDELTSATRPLEVQFGSEKLTIQAEDIALEPALDQMLEQAQAAKSGERIPLNIQYDEAKLRAKLGTLAPSEGDGGGISVISDTKAISRSFVLSGSLDLDVDAAVKQIDERLQSPDGSRRVTLAAAAGAARPTPEQLQQQLEAMAKSWKGTLGVYVYDIGSGKQIAGVNENSAFTAASTIKVAIMLNAYINVTEFTSKQQDSLKKMIVDSDNLKANDMLAAAAGGSTTESAFVGAEMMSELMADLGLKNTFLYVPFEAGDFIKLYKIKFKTGPKQGGEAPFTGASNTLRTTPFEMGQIYVYLDQCSKGQGVLLEKYSKTLSADRCEEMIGWLKKNADKTRMLSGLPAGADVAHKSGWIPPQIQADAGIIHSPGGDFIISIYAYQPAETYSEKMMKGLIGNVGRLVYSYYNPAPVAQ